MATQARPDGFKFPSRTNVAIWLVAGVVLTSLTIKDFITLLNQYLDNNVQTNAFIVLENSTMSMPDLTVCMVYDDYACSDRLLGSDDHNRYQIDEAIDTINRLDQSQDNRKLFQSALRLSKIFDYLDESPGRIFNPENAPLLNLSFIDRINISNLNYLTDKFMQEICTVSLFHSNVETSSFSDIKKYCQELHAMENPYTTGWCNRTCFPLPTSMIKFEKNNDQSVFFLTRYNARQVLGDFEKIELFDNNVGRHGKPMVVSVKRDKLNAVKVRFRLHSQVINEGTPDSCYSYDNYDQCMFSCRVNKTLQKCSCIPFSYRTFTKNIQNYCTYSSYNRCIAQSQLEIDDIDCARKCQKLCSVSFYQWTVMEEYTDLVKNDWIDLKFQTESFSYTKFNLDTKMSLEQFLTQVGGLLNFYLGVSGLSLFVVLLTTIKWANNKEVIRKFFRRKKSSSVPNLFTILGPLWFVNELVDRARKDAQNERKQEIEDGLREKIQLEDLSESKKETGDSEFPDELKRHFERMWESKVRQDEERFKELEKRLMEQVSEIRNVVMKHDMEKDIQLKL